MGAGLLHEGRVLGRLKWATFISHRPALNSLSALKFTDQYRPVNGRCKKAFNTKLSRSHDKAANCYVNYLTNPIVATMFRAWNA